MGKVIITVTCDWDGAEHPTYSHVSTIAGMNYITDPKYKHKKLFESIPITHFICPVYFIRTKVPFTTSFRSLTSFKKLNVTTHDLGIKNIVKTTGTVKDEVGLHLHSWNTLINKYGLTPISTDDWNGGGDQHDDGTTTDKYHGVPLGKFSQSNIEKMLEEGRKTLFANLSSIFPFVSHFKNYKNCKSFRCGGWMTCDNVLKALKNKGFFHEASAVPGSIFPHIGSCTLHGWLAQLWGNTKQTDNFLQNDKFRGAYGTTAPKVSYSKTLHQALIKYFQPKKIDGIVEVPDTGLLADYTNAAWMKKHIDEAIKLSVSKDVYISLGFHMDTAKKFIDSLMEALAYANKTYGKSKIQYKTVSEIT